jgi:hypothetical protein
LLSFPGVESIERKALFLLVALAIFLAFDRPDAFTTTYGRAWQVVVYIVGLLAAAGAAVALAAAVAPPTVLHFQQEQRSWLIFFSLALLVAGMLSNVLLRAYATYYLHRHGSSI